MKDYILFPKHWYETGDLLPEELRLPFFHMILDYAFMGVEPVFGNKPCDTTMLRALWPLIKACIDGEYDDEENE